MRPTARALLLLSTLAGTAMLTLPAPGLAQTPRAPAAGATGQQVNRIVAVINGDIVTQADVDGRRRLFALNAGLNMTPEVLQRLTPQVTRLLVDERLRVQEVQRRRIPVPDTDIATAVAELERRNGLPAGGLVAQLRRAGVEPRVLYDQLRVQIGWARLVRQLLGPQAEPSEAAVAELIASQRARTGQAEFLVSEIFVPVDDPAEEPEVRSFVDEVVSQLRRGVPFPVAATQFSQAQTALQGGDLGWVGAEALDREVAEVVRQMPPGAIANPIRVPGGFQIIALRQKREVGRDMATMLTLRQLIASLQPGRASQPVIAPDGVAVIMVCTRESRNQAELTPDAARAQLLRDRAELLSRQVQRDLRRRAQIEMRS